MNLTNKLINIESLTVVSYPPESTVKVTVSEEVIPGAFQVTGTYSLKFDTLFSGFNDPQLLQFVNEVLINLP
jgi:hypothetical protein